jgi:peptide/nickel transport system substrate-binding protein
MSRVRATVVLGALLTFASLGCTRVGMLERSDGSAASRHPYTIAHTLRIAAQTDFASLNPHLDGSAASVSELTMAWLLRSGRDDRPIPELAMQVPSRRNGGISPDGKTIVYHLRHDARWSDGAPFTAADVVFSTKTILDPRTNEQTRFFFDDIAAVTAPDKYTVVLRLKRPAGGVNFDYFYSVGTPCILPAHLLAHLTTINTAPYNALPVGIGPFKYVRWDRESQIVMVADPLYFRGRPKLDRIVMRSLPSTLAVYGALRTHTLDLAQWLPFLSGGIEKEPHFQILRHRPFGMEFFVLNVGRPPFNDLVVRRAVRLAIDRQHLHALIARGSGAGADPFPLSDSPYPVGHPMYDETLPFVAHDPAAANRLLERAGWRPGPDGIRVKNGQRLEILFAGPAAAPLLQQTQELLRIDLRSIGAQLDTRNYVGSYLRAPDGPIARGNFDITDSNFYLDGFGDLSEFFGCDQRPPKGFNWEGFCDHSLQPLFAEFGATYDESARKAIAVRIQREIFDDVPIINAITYDEYWIYNDDLRGFGPNRSGDYDDFMNVDI